MIKLNPNNIDSILQNYYSCLTQPVKGRRSVLKTKLKTALEAKEFTKKQKNFIQLLLNDSLKSVDESLLTCAPDKLTKYIQAYSRSFSFDFSKNVKFRNQLRKIFYYDDYDRWEAYSLARVLRNNVCPYCNRSYTFTVGTDKNKGTRPQFDHFFSKDKYPYLALSFYNLIPSCNICNSNLKRNTVFSLKNYLHPYIECFEKDMKFSLSIKNINFIDGKADNYDVVFKESKTAKRSKIMKCKRHIKLFKLKELYNSHKDYVDEIITKSRIYTPAYIDSLYTSHKGLFFATPNDAKKMIIGNYTNIEDFGKRPLSKLSTDISHELKLI